MTGIGEAAKKKERQKVLVEIVKAEYSIRSRSVGDKIVEWS
jgi:hypothetical protein